MQEMVNNDIKALYVLFLAIFKMADIVHLELKGYGVTKTLKITIPECL